MASAYETCNDIIASHYKVDYTNTKGFCNPPCTEQACAWNQGTKEEVVPKRIADLFVRKVVAFLKKENWDSLHARLHSHYKAWSYKKKNTKRSRHAGNMSR